MSDNGFFAIPGNLTVIEEQYARWQADNSSVSREWQIFFSGFDLGILREPIGDTEGDPAKPQAQQASSGTGSITSAIKKTPGRAEQERVEYLVASYRASGHTVCNLDPLGFNNQVENSSLNLETFQLTENDLSNVFAVEELPGIEGTKATLGTIVDHLKKTYCGTIGVEYMHIQDRAKRLWVREAVEKGSNQPRLTSEEKKRVLIKLNQAEMLEHFIHTKFLGQKRFSLEGGESLMPALDAIIELGPELGIKELVLGMAHRGRLNVLCNTLNKNYEEVFTEFEGNYDLNDIQGDGDVKYHLGFSSDHVTSTGKKIHLSLSPNPSHLEAVNPVVLGRVRAKQRQHADNVNRAQVAPLIIHGDAAIAGQGLVMECFQLTNLDGYKVGGCIHVVINNQIGFTTLPGDSRSTRYCTDIAKMVDAPIFHVNGDDPEAVVHAAKIATRFRQEFKSDVVLDIVCYRRYGHNESDEPNYTQPTMYARINEHERVSKIYTRQLLQRKDIAQTEVEAIATIMQNQLGDALTSIKAKPAKLTRERFGGVWEGMSNRYTHEPVATGVPVRNLEAIGRALSTWPEGFNIHPKIKRMAEERGKTIAAHGRIEWALGELLAYGSLLLEGTPVRLSGQDCRRGTFSQRHSYWYDTTTRERYAPMDHIAQRQAKFCVYNSPLSEAAVLGFDYGYSLAEPNMLITWEAQFGDFVNGAQVIIDQFLSSSESKWGRASGLVMMLPHGQEGAGPEHSSARLERFLQACAEDNMQVAYCTTAAQHFHILRRQMHRKMRKPLILMTPKSHLRSKQAASDFVEFSEGRFHEILPDPNADKVDASTVKRVVLTSGKVAHELLERRNEEKLNHIAVIRIEQLYPLHEEELVRILSAYPKAEFVWCQEEPQNMGAWFFIEPHLRRLLRQEITYAGREAAASPAPGSMSLFTIEQEALISAALGTLARKPAKHH